MWDFIPFLQKTLEGYLIWAKGVAYGLLAGFILAVITGLAFLSIFLVLGYLKHRFIDKVSGKELKRRMLERYLGDAKSEKERKMIREALEKLRLEAE